MPTKNELIDRQIEIATKTPEPLKYLKDNGAIDQIFEIDNPVGYLESKGINNNQFKDFIFKEENTKLRDMLFSKIFDFSTTNITDSMRLFMLDFPLVGMEAGPVERALESFSKRYAKQHNLDEDNCYVLATAILMLQTSLHKPNLKEQDRMDLTKFKNLVSGIGIVNKKEIKEIEDIYNNINNCSLGKTKVTLELEVAQPDKFDVENWVDSYIKTSNQQNVNTSGLTRRPWYKNPIISFFNLFTKNKTILLDDPTGNLAMTIKQTDDKKLSIYGSEQLLETSKKMVNHLFNNVDRNVIKRPIKLVADQEKLQSSMASKLVSGINSVTNPVIVGDSMGSPNIDEQKNSTSSQQNILNLVSSKSSLPNSKTIYMQRHLSEILEKIEHLKNGDDLSNLKNATQDVDEMYIFLDDMLDEFDPSNNDMSKYVEEIQKHNNNLSKELSNLTNKFNKLSKRIKEVKNDGLREEIQSELKDVKKAIQDGDRSLQASKT